MTALKHGMTLEMANGDQLVVGRLLGSGGQGDVFQVETPVGDQALKWYFASKATPAQRNALESITGMRTPDARLLWPRDFVESGDRFGYLMDIRPDRFTGLPRIIKGRIDVDLRNLLRAAVGLVGAYRSIQAAGLAYRDIKDPNVFIDPENGDVLICDNDNAVPAASPSQIKGTFDFCAPELLVGGANPSPETDLHSLAVLLFMMLVRGHPLDGKSERSIRLLNDAARIKLYGREPVFVFDSADRSNELEPLKYERHASVVKHWSIWPDDLKALWTQAFTIGLRDPSARPTLYQWMKALSRVHDSLRKCHKCRCLTVAPKAAPRWSCWSCSATVAAGPRCKIEDAVIIIDDGAEIFDHHLQNKPGAASFKEPRLVFNAHPNNPDRVGLRNETGAPLQYLSSAGDAQTIDPGRSAPVTEGAELVMPSTTIEFRA